MGGIYMEALGKACALLAFACLLACAWILAAAALFHLLGLFRRK